MTARARTLSPNSTTATKLLPLVPYHFRVPGHGLAANDPARAQYQLWIFDGARDQAHPVDGGVFDVRSGDVVVPIHAAVKVFSPRLFAVTVERPGGVVVSKRERIVLTASL